jgi:hypothetical protein
MLGDQIQAGLDERQAQIAVMVVGQGRFSQFYVDNVNISDL